MRNTYANLKWIIISIAVTFSFIQTAYTQQGVAINTTGNSVDPSAMLDVTSTNSGILIPRMTESQKSAISSPATGLMIYQTDGVIGFWYYNGSSWVQSIGPAGATGSAGATGMTGATGVTGATGMLASGLSAGNTPYWDGSQWVINSSNIYNNGGSVGIGTNSPNISAAIDISSTNKGTLITRMTTNQRNAVSSPAEGLQIYNTTTKCFESYIGGAWNIISCPLNCIAPVSPSAGTHTVTETQIVWNWNTVPGSIGYKYNTTNDPGTAVNNGTSTSYTQTGLTCNTAYTLYVWAFNSCGISSSTVLPQSTSPCFYCGTSTVTDIDGNTYNTVSIGSQCWMKENLKTTKYKNNTAISNLTDNTQWSNDATGAYVCYNNNCATYNTTYGKLYNWYAVNNSNGLCPTGWHMPTDAEWCTMENTVEAGTDASCSANGWRGVSTGSKIKEAGTSHWTSPNTGATNSSGFTAYGGGFRDNTGTFYYLGMNGMFWTGSEADATSAYKRELDYSYTTIKRQTYIKTYGHSVRCVRN